MLRNPSMNKYLPDQLRFSSERSARLAYSARTPNVHGAISSRAARVDQAPSGGGADRHAVAEVMRKAAARRVAILDGENIVPRNSMKPSGYWWCLPQV